MNYSRPIRDLGASARFGKKIAVGENDEEQKSFLLCALTFHQISHVIQNPFHLFSIVAMVAGYFTSVAIVRSRNITGSRV